MVSDLIDLVDIDVFEDYNVSRYLGSAGIFVRREYRRRKIGEQLLKFRKFVCEKYKAKVATSVFTTTAANTMATKIGYKDDISKT